MKSVGQLARHGPGNQPRAGNVTFNQRLTLGRVSAGDAQKSAAHHEGLV